MIQRRNFLKGLGIVVATAIAGTPALLNAAEEKAKAPKGPNEFSYDMAIAAITSGKAIETSDKIDLVVPEIAENGAVVPVKVTVNHPMEESNYIKAIHILAKENNNVRCADVMLTPMSGKAYFATRIKLGKTQDVVALVETSTGNFIMTAKSVKVTIGGCG